MRRFIIRFIFAVAAFGIANLVSLFVRSDDLFTPDTPDAMTRFGFPFLVYKRGGPVALDYFGHTALWGEIAIACVASGLAAACYSYIRQDVLRTLG